MCYWVAGLSVVNWIILHQGGGLRFVVGLGITVIADNAARAATLRAPAHAAAIHGFVLLLNVSLVLLFAVIGWLSRRRLLIANGFGMILYFLDGLILLLFRDAWGIAFHGFALFFMLRGFVAFYRLSLLVGTPTSAGRARRPAYAVPRNRR
jgi:hypothetical protein